MGPSRADEQLITTSLIAHGSGSFPGACSKWSEASDSRQTLPNAVRGASQRVCGKHSSEVTAEAQNTYACSIHTQASQDVRANDKSLAWIPLHQKHTGTFTRAPAERHLSTI